MTDRSTPRPSSRRAAVYLRTGPLAEMLESDPEPLQAYAAERGYETVDVYRDEGKSGRDRKRAGLARLRADAAQGRFDLVVVAHRTRLAATEVDTQALIEELERHGVTVDSLAGDHRAGTALSRRLLGRSRHRRATADASRSQQTLMSRY